MGSVLVTGGAGFIGSNTVAKLVELRSRGLVGADEIIAVDNFYSGSPSNLDDVRGSVAVVEADVRRPEQLEEAARGRGVDRILHLAAIVSVEEAYENPRLAFETNVLGTLNALELARRLDAVRFVYASSVAVYGEPVEVPIRESHPTRPVNLYGLTKLMGELLALQYSRDYGLDVVCLRYLNVYGPRMRGGPYGGVVYKFVSALARGERPVIYGDGMQTRDFVYVEDVADANVRALFAELSGGSRVLNIGTGRETSIIELLRIISGILGVEARPEFRPPRRGDVRRSVADITLAREVLGWEPRTSLEEGLRRTVEWFVRSHGVAVGGTLGRGA